MDWLSRLFELIPVQGRVDLRCFYGAPWRIEQGPAVTGEMAYHAVVAGSAILEDPQGRPPRRLLPGDILLLPHGDFHVLHDGSGATPQRPQRHLQREHRHRRAPRPDVRSLRFRGAAPSPVAELPAAGAGGAGSRAQRLDGASGHRRTARRAGCAAAGRVGAGQPRPAGLLALAGHPRLAPALTALFREPARPWPLPELARLCNMSRATFARQFQDTLGKSASELLTDIRMTLAANELKKPSASTTEVAETVGYRSEAAFQRVFKQRMGMTPARWRKTAQVAEPSGA